MPPKSTIKWVCWRTADGYVDLTTAASKKSHSIAKFLQFPIPAGWSWKEYQKERHWKCEKMIISYVKKTK